MTLKSLLHREICEGMTEGEVASAVGVSLPTLTRILSGEDPQNPAVWTKFGRYFRTDVNFLRTGESAYAKKERRVSKC